MRSDDETPKGRAVEGEVRGERGRPAVSAVRSLQSRTSSIMACGLMILLGGGMLTWYYTSAVSRQSRARLDAQSIASRKTQGEMPLPPLDAFDSYKASSSGSVSAPATQAAQTPKSPDVGSEAPLVPLAVSDVAIQPRGGGGHITRKSPAKLAQERLLAGAAFSRESVASGGADTMAGDFGTVAAYTADSAAGGGGSTTFPGGRAEPAIAGPEAASSSGGEIAPLLRPTALATTRAKALPTRRFLLSKGAFIDCTLETAIDSTLPGMTTCITATDTFSSDGTIVLLERGTKLIGETRGQVQQGVARVFVLWTEARTPTGVVVALDSPGTDGLGRSGLSGEVNRHFWERFGAAILISTLDGAVQAAVESSSRGGGPVIYNPSGSETVITDVLKSTVTIPPTIHKRNGDRIQVFVARDVDFRSVYELRTATTVR